MSDKSAILSDKEAMKTQRITVRLPASLRKRVRDAARRKGVGESDVIRGAIEQQFEAEDQAISAFEHAMKAGLVGAVQGLSPDLSTNPRHMEGFGSQ